MISPPHRSSLVRAWNAAAWLKPWRREGDSLSFDRILAKAGRRSVDSGWRSGLHIDALSVLVASINETGLLHSFGRFYVETFFTELLVQRSRLEHLWRETPGIRAERIEKPIIILGLPRSGTSFVFNLLAQDPGHRYLSNWETTVSQVPPEGSFPYLQDPRRRKGRHLMRFQNYLAPHLKDIHEFHLDGPEECTPLLMQGFATQALAGIFNVPAYSSWLDTAPHDASYAHHKRILQTLQWTYPAERWVLKSPDHLAAVDAILKVYPDACMVHLHRDPLQSVASWASLNATFRGITARAIEPVELGAQVLERLATDMDAYVDQRRQHGEQPFLDIRYDDLIRAPIETVEHIYMHFALPFASEARKAMQTFMARDRAKVRRHQYTAEDFGLSVAATDARFSSYMETFDVPRRR